jgi:hypothetical protein
MLAFLLLITCIQTAVWLCLMFISWSVFSVPLTVPYFVYLSRKRRDITIYIYIYIYIYILSSHVKWVCVRYFYPNWTTLEHIHRSQQNSPHDNSSRGSVSCGRTEWHAKDTLFVFFSKKLLLLQHLCEGSTLLKTVIVRLPNVHGVTRQKKCNFLITVFATFNYTSWVWNWEKINFSWYLSATSLFSDEFQ